MAACCRKHAPQFSTPYRYNMTTTNGCWRRFISHSPLVSISSNIKARPDNFTLRKNRRMKPMLSRRKFLQLSASLGVMASFSRLNLLQASAAQDYKALVCLFMFGGNDGHNLLVPLNG